MSNPRELADFYASLALDPGRLARFLTQPVLTVRTSDLSPPLREVVLSGDPDRVRRALLTTEAEDAPPK